MAGSLPQSWSLPGAFPNLRELTISASGLNGTIPAGWGSLRAFQNLEILAITDARLAGSVPAFNNAVLNTLILTSLGLRSGLEDFWNSTAPLALVDLANNSINGQVPDVPQALRSVIGLDVSQNSLQGTVPLSWLQPGNFLSHVSYLNLGQAWDNSVLQNNWRQTLCLHEDLYRADVTGQQLALLPKLVTRLAGQDAEIAGTDTLAWVQEGLSETAAFALVYTFEQGTNQLSSVSTICANPSATRVLLIVWLVFAGCCLAMLALYVCWQRWLIKQSGSLKRFLPVFAALQTMYSMFSGLGGFAFYCYDLVSNIVVLAQVWSKWPASVLLAIFLFHFAMTGAIVAFHGFYRLVGQKYDLSATGARFVTCAMIVSLLGSPFMIPVVLLLDTCAFIRQVLKCLQHIARLPLFCCLRPGYLVAFRAHHWLRSFDYLGFSWVDLENYESMHNLIAACLQSLPTVILNSIMFSLGNKPSHGIFLSTNLFVSAIVASLLAMLRCLTAVLWQASVGKLHPLRHASSVVVGKTLAGSESQPARQTSRVDLLAQQYTVSGSAPLGAPDQP